jgi:hypothetical protein
MCSICGCNGGGKHARVEVYVVRSADDFVMCLLKEQDTHALPRSAGRAPRQVRPETKRTEQRALGTTTEQWTLVVQSAADLRKRLHDWFALRVHRGGYSGIGFLSAVSAPLHGTNRSLPILDVSVFRTTPSMKWSAVRRVLAYRVH